jgi:hypothetical protein
MKWIRVPAFLGAVASMLAVGCTADTIEFFEPCRSEMVTGRLSGKADIGDRSFNRVKYNGREYLLTGSRSVPYGWDCADARAPEERAAESLRVADSVSQAVEGCEGIRATIDSARKMPDESDYDFFMAFKRRYYPSC